MMYICALINGSFVALPATVSEFISSAHHTTELVIVFSVAEAVSQLCFDITTSTVHNKSRIV